MQNNDIHHEKEAKMPYIIEFMILNHLELQKVLITEIINIFENGNMRILNIRN